MSIMFADFAFIGSGPWGAHTRFRRVHLIIMSIDLIQLTIFELVVPYTPPVICWCRLIGWWKDAFCLKFGASLAGSRLSISTWNVIHS